MPNAIAAPTLVDLPAFRETTEPAPAGFDRALADQLAEPRKSGAPTVVRAERTRLSGGQAAEALQSAWTQVTGRAPSEKTVAILTAQWAHETGAGQQMLNFNFGGIKGTGPSGLTAEYRTREGWGATERRITDRFRAYASAEEGAVDYVKLLHRRYAGAVQAAEAGDPQGFVRALKTGGYFTGSEQAYTRSVTRLTSQGLDGGFDAIGSVSGALSMRPTPQAVTSRGVDVASTPTFGETEAAMLAEMLSRTALRIAADPTPEDDR